jgi:hypothetical protein
VSVCRHVLLAQRHKHNHHATASDHALNHRHLPAVRCRRCLRLRCRMSLVLLTENTSSIQSPDPCTESRFQSQFRPQYSPKTVFPSQSGVNPDNSWSFEIILLLIVLDFSFVCFYRRKCNRPWLFATPNTISATFISLFRAGSYLCWSVRGYLQWHCTTCFIRYPFNWLIRSRTIRVAERWSVQVQSQTREQKLLS